ncbi:hypothetical protein GOODEAATRI_008917 [Goodea atripinnis]|uniref:VWFA domain-containing protein n=1 Tax=Goodea atripinnis TaxID=208336 RepID=A0ABV0MZW8_9TELE
MGTAVINNVREFIRRFVSTREIGPDAVQVGIAQFTTDPRLVMDLNSHGTKESLIAGLTALRPRQGQNINIGAALNFVQQSMLKADKGSRLSQDIPQLVMLIVSKKSSDSVEGPAQALQRMGVLTLAAGSRAAAEEELNKIAFSDRVVFMAKDFRQLFRNGREITDALSTLSGTVVIETPMDPVQKQRVFRDIVFLVDGSNYIGSNNLPFVRDLMINIVNQLDISPDQVQIGLMQFAEQPRIEFYLNTYNNKQDVVDKISQLRLTGGSVLNTGAAMNYAMNNMFQTTAGSRKLQKAVQVLILITGGPPQDNARSEADRLALENILTFTVSSGQADKEEMQKIAFVPNLAYHERSFSDLPAMADVIMPSLITTVGDISVGETDGLSGAERDVAFLIDGTDSVRADFPYIRDFILKVIEPLDIGMDRVRVTVVQHSETPTPVFYLNTYQTREEVIRAVRGMVLAGGRTLNTGAALRYMKATAMSDSHGSRAAQNVPQFLIVLAADRSMDSVKEPAGELKTDGVVPFGVGVKNADKRQIEAISHNPSFAFNVKEFSELGTIPPKVNTYVTLPKDQLAVTLQQVQNDAVERDIVFLLDGSDNTRDGFTDIKRFVKLIVEHLYVDKGLDRVSVVQFADSTKVNFHLNSHKTKNDNLNAIDNLAHKGGRRLNVGAALQFVRHRVFTSSMGSRRLEGVPQILIILTSKPSADSVKGPAFALQEHEIVAVGVGVGDANLADLEMIAFKPGFIYKVTDFSKLNLIQTQVLAALNIHKDNQETKNGISDLVVFLLDGSDDSRNGLPAFREFVRRMAEELDVGEGSVRLAVVQYSDDATAYFNLRTHKTRKAVIYAIRALRHKGGKTRNTGAALQFVQNHVFSASSGSRHLERVPQVLVLLTGGASSDDPEVAAFIKTEIQIQPPFGVGKKYDSQRRFPDIIDFISRLVTDLSIGINRDRVAVVQYSNTAEINFNLSRYVTKDDVLQAVYRLTHKGGYPKNIGAALQYVKDYAFTPESGSRIQQGAPQILILLSGGRSGDDIRTSVKMLKEMGVTIVAIGTSDADTLELQTISHEPKYALSVTDYEELSTVEQDVWSLLREISHHVVHSIDFVDTAKNDIVFLLDGSDGTRNGFPAMRDFVEKVVEKLNVGENKDRVSVVQFSRDAEVHFYLNTYNTREDIVDAIRGLRHRGGRPLNTGAALQYVRGNVFTNASGSRHLQGVPQMLILLTGGRSFDNVDAPASALKQQGIIVIGIGTRTSDSRELQKLSYEPNYALSVSEFTDLPSVQEELSSVMSTVLVRATPLAPTVTVVKKQPGRDVVFLLDGSDGTRTGFPAMRDFVQRVIETLSVDDKKDRVSVVQYSRDPAVQFYLNTYMTKGQILDAVKGLRHKGGRPLNTGAALQYLRDNVFTTSAGSRQPEGVPQVLILLSGGRSFDSVDGPAAALKQMGVLIFAIGSGGSDSRELQKVSHDPSYALSVSEFTDLPSVQQQLQASVEAVVIEVTPESPTVHGFYFFSSYLFPVDTAKKDIVFLLDGSDGTRNGFPAMRDFVEKVIEKHNIGENKDRVSVVQFSRDAEVHFYLNTYNTREDIVDAIRGLRHRGGRPLNTGAALQYVRGNVFTNASGSRHLQGVPQMLILLTGGRSFDNVDAPASALKQQGIIVIGIGTRTSDSRELQKLSYEPNYALSVSEFTDLPSVQEELSSVMSTVLVRATPLAPTVTVVKKQPGRDVVFLLDGSDGTRTGFPAMRDFVQRVIETLSVDDKKDRVSVVQYSRDPAVQFYLNTYMTKGQILDAVKGLRHKGGRPLNTGAALQYLRDNVFTTSAGSRQPEGVPQVLILLSGGRSFDSVDGPAAALKQMGVLIFAIGSGGSDSRELQKVSHDPSYALSVSEFTDLPSVQQQLQASVEAVVIEVTPESPTVHGFYFFSSYLFPVDTAKKDIVFLLDGSDGTRNGFPAMRDFVEKVVEKLNVGENKDRVSVVQFSRDAEVHFYLNTYNTREDIVDAIRGLRHRGGRPLNTGAALQYVRGNVFTNASGSRHLQGVPQMLILLTGGRSFDNVDAPASALKQQGIIVIGIGTRTSDSRELQKLSYEPNYALSVSEFTDLPSVQEQLSSVMSTVLVRATPLAPTVTVVKKQPGRDVVFLLDGSDGTRTGFPAMRDFVQRVIETLSVDDKKDRVSVVQYSRDPAVQFYLNTYMTKGQILDAVKGLRHKGGRPLNTGAALQYLRDNVFTTSAGSRQPEGVPQVLILLSGGRSFDSVDGPAAALKQMGVLIFAIGSGGSDSRELQKVSHDPSYALSVSEFTDLPSVQQQLQASVEAVVIEVTPESPTVHGMLSSMSSW